MKPLFPRVRAATLALLFIAALAPHAHAQAGPPFRTDDPETPGNKHWEINLGLIGDRNPGAGTYQVPDFDINYGLGDRIQLNYEFPLAVSETRYQPPTATTSEQPGNVLLGLGNTALAVKWRFYQHNSGDPWFGRNPHAQTNSPPEEKVVNFSISTYPRFTFNNPTRSVARGVVPSGPDFFLPLEANARLGPVRFDGEVGYHFSNQNVPQSWIRGLLVGHEFNDRTEAYLEIYDQQDANTIPAGRGVGQFATGLPKQRQTTLGIGGRQALNKQKSLLLMLMGGRSFQAISADNSQPSWIAYVGLQFLLGPQ